MGVSDKRRQRKHRRKHQSTTLATTPTATTADVVATDDVLSHQAADHEHPATTATHDARQVHPHQQQQQQHEHSDTMSMANATSLLEEMHVRGDGEAQHNATHLVTGATHGNMTATAHGHDGDGARNATAHNMHGNMKGNTMNHSMKMSFHGGFSELIVFDIWRVDTMSGMIWSALAVFTLALIYEGLKIWQENLLMQAQKACVRYTAYARTSKDRTVYSETRSHGSCCSGRLFSVVHVLQTLLHLIQVICSYFLMLVVMTYNAWLCTGVVLGATLGFFVFGWKRKVIVDSSDICH